ncbi:nucleoside/nucleotide kinase family protein [Carnimonas bestiolae]|uniref:nucleoside/nucleotide kinase family protein n=1 Tax=Carnimonas bestiolae TaxID=3402172 RepID=UPI003EDBF8D0
MSIETPSAQFHANLLTSLIRRIEQRHTPGTRSIIGLVGAPGAGKSTLVEALLARLPHKAAVLPMDGFHLANCQLERLSRADRKGAPDTFDAYGYVALLERLRPAYQHHCIYAPSFERRIEEPIAGAIAIEADVELVITEGNYLLLDSHGWENASAQLNECWYLEIDDTQRREQLIARHQHFGRSREAAIAWAEHTDEPNARLIAACKARADHIVQLTRE